ncbi:MAG: SAM-dependent methyltransferase [Thiothrix lacustris]|uniref:site-specific DNA-methyltransferase (adenine-specific) n=1 Tax=Thiothrix lacustris TaxID=525917 RepID=A0A1Y1QTZ1_9GAMM|nr:MAG: SAM-dependent methyltransferase [Thiothrix lacustris]
MIITDTHADAFIQRWQGKDGSEKANLQLFLSELCELLGVEKPQPAHADNTLNAYVFERRIDLLKTDRSANTGFIDLYRRGCFVLEGKSTGKKYGSTGLDTAMSRARNQADGYIRSLPAFEKKPPFMILTDVGHVLELYAEFTCSGSTYTQFPDSASYRIKLDDLRKPDIRARLAAVWADPHSLDESKKAAKVTKQIATQLAALAKSLEAAHSAETVGTFLMRCLFTMFAEDVALLPPDRFTHLLEKLLEMPERFKPAVENLWALMDKGGFDGGEMVDIKRFNGGLFAKATALALDKTQIQMLLNAAKADWRYVEPAIFGTLLERALNPKERHKLGAHYTPRAYVERLVLPTVLEPLRQQWQDVQVEALLEERLAAKATSKTKGRKNKEAIAKIRAFHQHLCQLRILDPACGSGNFLYVTLEHLKRLEGEVLGVLADLGDTQGSLEMQGVSVNPQQFLGLEVNPRAAAIAEMVLWIGYLQWHFRVHGNVAPAEPILRDFHNIENRDAVLAYDGVENVLDAVGNAVTRWDGRTLKTHPVTGKDVPDDTAQVPVVRYLKPRKAEWPAADYIIGNPPYLGARTIRMALGDDYLDALRTVYHDVPDNVDYVMYWWKQSADLVNAGKVKSFGFITTNSITQSFSRKIIETTMASHDDFGITFAIPDHPWVDSTDGANVRVAMTVFSKAASGQLSHVIEEGDSSDGEVAVTLTTKQGAITPSLTIGIDLHASTLLNSNSGVACVGYQLTGKGFVVDYSQACKLDAHFVDKLGLIKPMLSGRDITQTSRNLLAIDAFGLTAEQLMRTAPAIYQWLVDNIKDARDMNRDSSSNKQWWQFARARADFRPALIGLECVLTTSLTAKYRIFVSVEPQTICDSTTVMFALDDAFYFGVLSSCVHCLWAFKAGGTLEDRPRYTKSLCFDAFPFPDASEGQKARIRELAEQIDAHRKRQQAAHPTLTLTNMYNVLEKLRSGEPLNAKEKLTHEQGLTSILQELHDNLDRAVFDAYGWSDLASQLVGKPGATTPLPDKPDAQAQAEEELLSRLVDLNTERALEEANGHIRWLRPDFQAPEKQASTPLSQQEDLELADDDTRSLSVVEGNSPAAKRDWPKTMREQIKVVRELLTIAPLSVAALGKQFKRKPSNLPEVLDALQDLGMVTADERGYWVV